jgi:CheY-like chemotaxis protein
MTHKLLLADDSVTIQRVIELTFADEDIEVIAVGDGQLAIDRLETDPPDIVLADVDMPKRDGYEVAAYVKSRPKLAHIPVVLLTGAFEPIDQARAVAAGSSDVLAKPFEPQMVINRVKQLLGKKRDEGQEPAAPQSVAPPQLQPASPPRPPARSNMPMNDEHASRQSQPARQTPGQSPQQPVSLDDYFDQLDAAFSNLQTGASGPGQATMTAEEDWMTNQPQAVQPPPPPAPERVAPTRPNPVAAAPVAPPPVRPVAPPLRPEPLMTPPAESFAQPQVAARPAVPPPAPVPPPPPRPAPPPVMAKPAPVPPEPPTRPAANPFAELSAAKAEVATARAATPVITDEVIEEVVTRVLQRLSDRVVRESVTEIVSKTAERLVQDEILRIKTEGQ